MKILAVLQARLSSKRFPNKVFKPLLGAPMIERQIERILRSQCVDKLVVATSSDASDNAIATLMNKLNVTCHRGPLNDVLTRICDAARPHQADHIIRLTGDCPLTDPAIIDQVAEHHVRKGADYTSNCLNPTYPDGLDVEVVRKEILELAKREADTPAEREHATLFIHRRPERFHLAELASPINLSALRWTVDEPDDFELVEAIYNALYPQKPNFTTNDILRWLDTHPNWQTHNTAHTRNEGLLRSENTNV